MGAPTAARLVLAGHSLVDYSIDSGEVLTTELAGRVVQALRVSGGDVLLVESSADRTLRAVFLADHRTAPVPLGRASALIAAADDRRVWLEQRTPTDGVMRRVDLTGQVEATIDLSRWRTAVRETPYGMVTTSAENSSRSLQLWNIDSMRVATTYWLASNYLVVAADAEGTAFLLPACDLPVCPLKVALHRTGGVIDLPMPPGWATSAAAFSPDGKSLAVFGKRVRGVADREATLLVVDLESRAVRSVTGIETLTNRSALLTWSADSRWFFAVAGRPAAPLLGFRLGGTDVQYVPFPRLAGAVDPADLTSLSAH